MLRSAPDLETKELKRRHLVVCVDDEAPILAALQRLLRHEPYDVLFTDRTDAALDWIARQDVSVIIADQRMPGMSGSDLLRSVRERSPKTIRVMLTGYADMEALSDAVNGGAIRRLLRKPWDDDIVRQTIRELLLEREIEDSRGDTPPPMEVVPLLRRMNQELEEVTRRQLVELRLVRGMLDRIDIPFLAASADLRVADCNAAFLRFFGEGAGSFVGRDVRDILPQDITDHMEEILTDPRERTIRHVPLAGERVTATLKPLVAEEELIGVILTAVPEATTKVSAARANGLARPDAPPAPGPRALRDHLATIDALHGLSPDPVAVVDREIRILYINESGARVLGHDRGEVQGRHWRDLGLPEAVLERFGENCRQALASSEPRTDETWFPTPLGQRAFEYVLSPIRPADGSPPEALVCAVRDVTRRKQTEDSLREMNVVLESAVEGFAHFGTDGRFLTINKTYATLLGYNPEELAGREWTSVLHPGDAGRAREAYLRMMVHGRAELDSRAVRKDGTVFNQQILLFKALDHRRNFIGHYSFMKDVTEREQHTAQQLQGQKLQAVGQLAAGIAHEINNPVGFILTNLSVMREYIDSLARLGRAAADPGAAKEYDRLRAEIDVDFIADDAGKALDDCIEGAGRIRDIVGNLRDFAHVDEGQTKPADLHELIENSVRICWNELKYKTSLHRDFGTLPPVRCYPQRVSQVLVNLLVNAAQAIDGKGEIRITTRAEGDQALIRIADTGRGIPPANLDKIFDPFFTTKPLGQGTGMGLHVAYQIVKSHDGRIDVRSEPGQGTEFTIRLPIAGPAGGPHAPPT